MNTGYDDRAGNETEIPVWQNGCSSLNACTTSFIFFFSPSGKHAEFLSTLKNLLPSDLINFHACKLFHYQFNSFLCSEELYENTQKKIQI